MKIEQLTFTRFIAAISIVILHCGRDVFPFNNNLISDLVLQANIGVSYFFILSGFVMIIANNNKTEINLFEYYKNRLARIYPVYFLAIFLLVVFNIVFNNPIPSFDLILNLLVIQSWIPGKALSFNSPGWSLSVEFLFYAIFPLLFNSFYNKKEKIKNLVIIIFLIFLVSQFITHLSYYSTFYDGFPSKSHDLLFYFPLMHLNEFLIGNLAGLFFVTKISERNKNYDLQILLILFFLIIALKNPIGLIFQNGLLCILFVPFILLISLNNGIITSLFKWKPLIFLGEISFGIYILQFPVFNYTHALYSYLGFNDPSMFFYFATFILIIVSGISYIIIETPLRNKLKNWRK